MLNPSREGIYKEPSRSFLPCLLFLELWLNLALRMIPQSLDGEGGVSLGVVRGPSTLIVSVAAQM